MPTKEAWESYRRFPRVRGGTVYVPRMDEQKEVVPLKSWKESLEEFEREQREWKRKHFRGRTTHSYEDRYPGRKPLKYKPTEKAESPGFLEGVLETVSSAMRSTQRSQANQFISLLLNPPFLCPRKANGRKFKVQCAKYELSRAKFSFMHFSNFLEDLNF